MTASTTFPAAPQVRLYVEHPLGPGQAVALSREQAHYLFSVMRLGPGALVEVFNGTDGAWQCRVAEAGKRGGLLSCDRQLASQSMPPDLWLLFAPLKKARTDFVVEKAVELGVRRIIPVSTQFTNSERVRQDRLQAHAVEAAEQCGATFVPRVSDLARLSGVLDTWPEDRSLLFCDEKQAGAAVATLTERGPWAVLIGPEGGFSDTERARLASLPQAVATALGPRILRAETAALAALTLWQAQLGDWT